MSEILEKKVKNADFLKDSGINLIFDAIEEAGGKAFFVGGCVRDALLGKEIKDIDITTDIIPKKLEKILNKQNIKNFPSGIEFGTITAVIDKYSKDKKIVIGKKHVEITTFRKDIKTDGRHAKVEYTKDIEEDAKRRDFTFNALYADRQGNVYNFFDGYDDLVHGEVKFIGEPEERIKEDFLRILRFFRFLGYFDKGEINDKAMDACSKMAYKLEKISKERIKQELFKILKLKSPSYILQLMYDEGVLPHILPEAENFELLRTLVWIENTGSKLPNVKPSVIRRLACLIGFGEQSAKMVSKRLSLTKRQSKHITSLISRSIDPHRKMEDKMTNMFLHLYGANLFRDMVLLKWAEEKLTKSKNEPEEIEAWYDLLEKAQNWLPLEFPLKGQDVKNLGIEEGPKIGELLHKAEMWWQQNNFELDKTELIDYIKAVLEKKEDHNTISA